MRRLCRRAPGTVRPALVLLLAGVLLVPFLPSLPSMDLGLPSRGSSPSPVRAPHLGAGPPPRSPDLPGGPRGGAPGALSLTANASSSRTDVGLIVTFHAIASGGLPPYLVAWTFGDGTTGSGPWVNHSFTYGANFTVTAWANDSAAGTVNASLVEQVHADPAVAVLMQPSPTDVGVPVAFQSLPLGGTPPYAVRWYLGDGTWANGSQALHAYAAPGAYRVDVFENDSVGAPAQGGEVLQVFAGLQGAALALAPDPVDLGQNVSFTANASGGTPPFSYLYTGLPPGCPPQNQSQFGCTPTRSGTYNVTVLLHDLPGDALAAQATLTVAPDPRVASFTATPGTGEVGHPVALAVTVSGGLPPYSFVYAGLPTGCASEDLPSVVCVPSATGNSSLLVTVTDAQGFVANATLSLSIAPAPPPPPGGAPGGGSGGGNGSAAAGPTAPWWAGASFWGPVDGGLAVALILLVVLALLGTGRAPPRRTPPGPRPTPGPDLAAGAPPAGVEEELDAPVP